MIQWVILVKDQGISGLMMGQRSGGGGGVIYDAEIKWFMMIQQIKSSFHPSYGIVITSSYVIFAS